MATVQHRDTQLPEDVLARILAYVPVQERLGSCSLASRSMHAAAVAATEQIQVEDITPARGTALCAWLQQHGNQAVRHLGVCASTDADFLVKLPLPWRCLTQLQHLQLNGLLLGLQLGLACSKPSSSSQAQQQQQQQQQQHAAATLAHRGVFTRKVAVAAGEPVQQPQQPWPRHRPPQKDGDTAITLAALTALTSLDISCMLPACCSPMSWITSQLQLLTNLRDLSLGSLYRDANRYVPGELEYMPALGHAIGQLAQLTRLDLTLPVDGRALSFARNLTQLQDLIVDNVGSGDHPLRLQDLPCSLAYLSLDLSESRLDCTTVDGWQMPALQELRVLEWRGGGFKPAVLARMTQLRWLALSVGWQMHPPWGISDVAAVLPQLQQLRWLKLCGMQHWPEVRAAAEAAAVGGSPAAREAYNAAVAAATSSCAAFTASSQLSSLTLENCWIPAAAVQHMFPAAKLMPVLQVLDVSCCAEDHERDFHRNGGQAAAFDSFEISKLALRLQPGDLHSLVTCCPCLRELSTVWFERGIRCPELRELLQLSELTRLGIGGADIDDEAAAVLAGLTGLQELDVLCATEMTVEGLACLTSLTDLQRLRVLGAKIQFNSSDAGEGDDDSTAAAWHRCEDVRLDTQAGSPPVHQQLEELCSSSPAALAVMYKRAKVQLQEQAQQLRFKDEAMQVLNAQLRDCWLVVHRELQLRQLETMRAAAQR